MSPSNLIQQFNECLPPSTSILFSLNTCTRECLTGSNTFILMSLDGPKYGEWQSVMSSSLCVALTACLPLWSSLLTDQRTAIIYDIWNYLQMYVAPELSPTVQGHAQKMSIIVQYILKLRSCWTMLHLRFMHKAQCQCRKQFVFSVAGLRLWVWGLGWWMGI